MYGIHVPLDNPSSTQVDLLNIPNTNIYFRSNNPIPSCDPEAF